MFVKVKDDNRETDGEGEKQGVAWGRGCKMDNSWQTEWPPDIRREQNPVRICAWICTKQWAALMLKYRPQTVCGSACSCHSCEVIHSRTKGNPCTDLLSLTSWHDRSRCAQNRSGSAAAFYFWLLVSVNVIQLHQSQETTLQLKHLED